MVAAAGRSLMHSHSAFQSVLISVPVPRGRKRAAWRRAGEEASRFLIRSGLALSFLLTFTGELPALDVTPDGEARIEAARRQVQEGALASCDLSLFLAGDTILTVPWSADRDPDFYRLIGEIRAADVAIVNLETLIHEFRGYPQADSGGTYMAAPPVVAEELRWAGVDLVGHANNHTFDYGAIGVLENLEHVTAAGLLLAGSGPDLQAARAPRFFAQPKGTVALVSMSSTFAPYGKASAARSDLHGRPGLNPLSVTGETVITIPRSAADVLRRLAKLAGFTGDRFTYPRFELAGLQFEVGGEYDFAHGLRPVERDRIANLEAIEAAAEAADVVVASLHYHGSGDWLRGFAHEALERGADVFYVHGQHKVFGVEVAAGRPIFYGLGDFVYQNALVAPLPTEFYERYGLGDDATPQEAQAARTLNGTRSHASKRWAFEGVAASLCFKEGALSEARLLPVDLNYDARPPVRGRPHLADPALGARIVEKMRAASEPFGTRLDFDGSRGVGLVALD